MANHSMLTYRVALRAVGIVLALSGPCVWGASPDAWTPPSGLQLWLDAQNLQPPTSSAPLPQGSPVPHWADRSPQQRHFAQPDAAQQPRVQQVGDQQVVRFDGHSQHLRSVGQPQTIREGMIWIVFAAHDNPGEFRGIFAANAQDERDYQSGFNLDLGFGPTTALEQVSVEGKGFGGTIDLYQGQEPFGTLHQLEVQLDRHEKVVRLIMDELPAESRPWDPQPLSFEQLTLGARFYENGPGPQKAQGFLPGDVAELLIFDRQLTPTEVLSVREYLRKKHAQMAERLPPLNPTPPVGVATKAENRPLIQMFQPGFEVHELPVTLTNVNNVRFRHDGKLVALGYNGDVHLLSDTDGDGLEETAHCFWKNDGTLRGPIGLLLTSADDRRGQGFFVPSKGKVSLIVDTNGDDVADSEKVVATGWPEIFTTVDAVGVAQDAQGNLYFGLGVADFSNAYQIGPDGKAAYRRHAQNGTIQKVSADFQHRETVCTGMRFPVSLAVNHRGDLFATEQEGATWLPNGNPLDELLHIQPGRHYGFPPRHPQHNPDVIDEPSLEEFGPQHQSTCGMVFNELPQTDACFGPPAWRHAALITGESRGKIWRTTLAKTSAGYVAHSQLLAALQMLTVDVCVAPNGDLVVACHSGPPDWGTGPTGIGKLFRIRMTNPRVPRPIAAWAESPHEVRVAFDAPLDPATLAHLARSIHIEYGEHVRAGDRFENLVPPYAVVHRQRHVPRHPLQVAGAAIAHDGRTLLIQTARMPNDVHYAITLPTTEPAQPAQSNQPSPTDLTAATNRPATTGSAIQPLPQHPQIDVDLSLRGVVAKWQPAAEVQPPEEHSIWLPHLDLAVSQQFLKGSASHQSFWSQCQKPGTLHLTTRLNLHHWLRPAIQPGASIDYTWPPEEVTVRLMASVPIVLQATCPDPSGIGTKSIYRTSQLQGDRGHVVEFHTSGDHRQTIPITVSIPTDGNLLPNLEVVVFTQEDPRERAVPLKRLVLPWVADDSAASDSGPIPLPAEIAGGDWRRGRLLFEGTVARCGQCHTLHQQGGKIGPDLSHLMHRDYASVLRDIRHPSFAINPDYINHILTLADGRILTGVLRTEGQQWLVGDEGGKLTPIDRAQVESSVPAPTSLMPTGLLDRLSGDEVRDLMTYMLTPAPRMPLSGPLPAPPVRTDAELEAVLVGASPLPESWRPLHIVLVAGEKDHGLDEHDYPAWQKMWGQLMSVAPQVEVSLAWDFPTSEQLNQANIVVFFQKGTWSPAREQAIDAYQQRGGGLVYLHWAVNGELQADPFAQRIGLASRPGIRYRHGPLTLDFTGASHPIARNFSRLELYDESYWELTGDVSKINLLATSDEEGAPRPQLWTYEHRGGRVFVSIPGHYSWTFDDPLFRVLLLRGMAWTAHEPVDRFNELVPLGARLVRDPQLP